MGEFTRAELTGGGGGGSPRGIGRRDSPHPLEGFCTVRSLATFVKNQATTFEIFFFGIQNFYKIILEENRLWFE